MLSDSELETRIVLNKSRLKETSGSSALMAGFGLVALIEMDVPRSAEDGQSFALQNHPMVVIFGLLTSALVFVHLFALMMATCMLPFVVSVGHQAERLRDFRETASFGSLSEALSPERLLFEQHKRKLVNSQSMFSSYIQAAWILSTGIGITLFAIDLRFIAFVKVSCDSASAFRQINCSREG
jgi:calcium release-activated calcium channel protein 1